MARIDGSNHYTLLSLGPDSSHRKWAVFLLPLLRCADNATKRPRVVTVSTE